MPSFPNSIKRIIQKVLYKDENSLAPITICVYNLKSLANTVAIFIVIQVGYKKSVNYFFRLMPDTSLTGKRDLNAFMGFLWGASHSLPCFIMSDDILALIMANRRSFPPKYDDSDCIFMFLCRLIEIWIVGSVVNLFGVFFDSL